MSTKNPSVVFLVCPTTAEILRTLPQVFPGLKMADVVRTACRRALDGEIHTGVIGTDTRSERVRIHAPATFKALCQVEATKRNQTLCRWVAGALSEHLADTCHPSKLFAA